MNMSAAMLTLRVRSITYQADGISAYELVDPTNNALPRFTAGAHIDIHLPNKQVRQYSLCNDPAEHHRYVICVQREQSGRGGSKALHDTTHVGQIVTVSEPRNNFSLAPDAARHLLLAGGIGITPFMAMVHTLRASDANWQLLYCSRTKQRTAFIDELQPEAEQGLVNIHHDNGDPEKSVDFGSLLADYQPGTHLYYCGPTGFMTSVASASAHWPNDAVHCEYFTAPDQSVDTDATAAATDTDTFQVTVKSSGAVFDVPTDKSIVQVLADNGIEVETSCEAGLCGTCRTGYLQGQPDHRDFILDDEERKSAVLICCARSLTPMLVLDL